MEQVQGVKLCVSQETGFIFEAMGEHLFAVVLDHSCFTVVKCGNLLLWMR